MRRGTLKLLRLLPSQPLATPSVASGLHAIPSPAAAAAAAACASILPTGQVRRIGTGKNRFNHLRKRATEQQKSYFDQLEGPKPQRKYQVDPKLLSSRDEQRYVFGYPNIMEQPHAHYQTHDQLLKSLRKLDKKYDKKPRCDVPFGSIGSIQVWHSDLFEFQDGPNSAVILPMASSLCPYRGVGLEMLEREGGQFVDDLFQKAKQNYSGREVASKEEVMTAGDTIVLERKNKPDVIFVIMPWFWQGSVMDAVKRYRFTVKSALNEANAKGYESVALPCLGSGLFGFEPRYCVSSMAEEAVEALLQIEAPLPTYALKKIVLMDSREETADMLKDAMVEVAHRWLPDRKLTTAAQYWGEQTRRMVVLPTHHNFFWKRQKVKFKQNHDVVRKERQNYIGNVVPRLWRFHPVHQPPPLMVSQQTGDVAGEAMQHAPRPFFYRGVSHWLFPSRRSGFHALRRSAQGKWVGRIRHVFPREYTKPGQ
mmetsp:Transcript_49845/g.106083  ORF Transcript_49845/g.106083 Transcript_49845/m.106083 type:complete len:480 (-) Transcript_49845:84-1523(-)